MQIIPTLPPPLPSTTPQELTAKALPHVHAQASAPLTSRAIDPSPRGAGSHKTRSSSEKPKGGTGTRNRTESGKDSSVDIKV